MMVYKWIMFITFLNAEESLNEKQKLNKTLQENIYAYKSYKFP